MLDFTSSLPLISGLSRLSDDIGFSARPLSRLIATQRYYLNISHEDKDTTPTALASLLPHQITTNSTKAAQSTTLLKPAQPNYNSTGITSTEQSWELPTHPAQTDPSNTITSSTKHLSTRPDLTPLRYTSSRPPNDVAQESRTAQNIHTDQLLDPIRSRHVERSCSDYYQPTSKLISLNDVARFQLARIHLTGLQQNHESGRSTKYHSLAHLFIHIHCIVNESQTQYKIKSHPSTTTLNSVYVVSHTVAAYVHLWSLGVLAAAGCGIGSVHAMCRSNLLVEPSEEEEGET
ncbi:hypothetical protein F511_42642 [Dorcoceras hygrometricum]|uniref:Uncharacterized protein n=1 Tax=Dorcoceras hygrometricum TaxID=472368 RepID=A0A2Z7BT66_9LAMI|nr:hypothetical protein F511_42642 [Dorcoceras hygrometricum]